MPRSAQELEQLLMEYKSSEALRALRELLRVRRNKHRDTLESREDPEARGKAKECKYLLQLLG